MIDSAEVRRPARRGTLLAEEVVVVSDGAVWIENRAKTVFAGQNAVFILDQFHVLERLAAALTDLITNPVERREW